MNFDYSEDQRLLTDAVSRFLREQYTFEKRAPLLRNGDAQQAMWRHFASLGLTALPFSTESGGMGGTPLDTAIVMQSFGSALVVEPYLGCIVMAGHVIEAMASPVLKDRLQPSLMAGELIVAWAHEVLGRTPGRDRLSARRQAGKWILSGERHLVLGGDMAHRLLVTARTEGESSDGWTLFLVDVRQPGLARKTYSLPDDQRAADFSFESVEVSEEDVLGEPGRAGPLIDWTVDRGTAALCAAAVGSMSGALAITVEYLKTRKQFDVPLASMQAIQHRVADMFVELELSRSMMLYAAACAAMENSAERRKGVAAAKIQIGRACRFIGQQVVQLHGGIGMTQEYPAGHHFRHLAVIDMLMGDADFHLERLGQAGGLIASTDFTRGHEPAPQAASNEYSK